MERGALRNRRAGTPTAPAPQAHLLRPAILSIAAAVVTITLKTEAWRLTDSVGFLSDVAGSLVDLAAALLALGTTRWATRPADEHRTHERTRVELLAVGVEGALVLGASLSVASLAVARLIHPVALEDVRAGIAVFFAATVVNLLVAMLLLREGRTARSPALEADGLRLITNLCVSEAVIAGVAVVGLAGWERLDPLIGLVVAVHILTAGVRRIRRSGAGPLDRTSVAAPPATSIEMPRAAAHRPKA